MYLDFSRQHLTPLKCFIVTYYGVTSHPSAISTKKVLQKLMTDEILTAPALFVICLMLQLALVLQANALVFSQSYARNFYMCIISPCKKWYKSVSCCQLCIPLLQYGHFQITPLSELRCTRMRPQKARAKSGQKHGPDKAKITGQIKSQIRARSGQKHGTNRPRQCQNMHKI